MTKLMESANWEIVSIMVLLLILGAFSHFWMTRFGKTRWMKAIGALLTLALYWILFGMEHPRILLLVGLLACLQVARPIIKNS